MIQTDQLWEDIYETVEKNWSILVLLNNYQLIRCDSGTVVILEGKKKKKFLSPAEIYWSIYGWNDYVSGICS